MRQNGNSPVERTMPLGSSTAPSPKRLRNGETGASTNDDRSGPSSARDRRVRPDAGLRRLASWFFNEEAEDRCLSLSRLRLRETPKSPVRLFRLGTFLVPAATEVTVTVLPTVD